MSKIFGWHLRTPTGATCSETGSNVLASWTSVGQRYRYQLTLHRVDDGTQVGDAVLVPAVTTGTVSSQVTSTSFSPTAVAATGQLNFTLRVRALPSASTTWLSPGALNIPVRFTPDRNSVRCGNDTETFVTIVALGQDSGSSPTDFVTNAAANTLTGTGEPGATVVVRRGGVQEGQFPYVAVATDQAGNASAPATQAISLDTIAPSITVTYPTSGLSVNLSGLLQALTNACGSGNAACGSVSDAVSGVVTVERTLQRNLLVSGASCLNAAGTAYSSGGCGTTFHPATVGTGTWRLVASPNIVYGGSIAPTFTLRVRATDAAGNVSSVVQVQWTVV